MKDTFSHSYGPWAVVAGASEGLGAAFCEAIAGHGLNLVLVARREPPLTRLADRIASTYRVTARTVVGDLADPDSRQAVLQRAADVDVGLLVYNAASSKIGSFLGQDLRDHHDGIAVNCLGPVTLVHGLGRRMARRGRGGILLMTSLSAFQGSALIANYAATRAYILSLAEALSFELQDAGVDVLACCAGATRTPAPTSRAVLAPAGSSASRRRNRRSWLSPLLRALAPARC